MSFKVYFFKDPYSLRPIPSLRGMGLSGKVILGGLYDSVLQEF